MQPERSLAFCMISSVSTVTASGLSLNCTPPQPLSWTSIKPGAIIAPLTGALLDVRRQICQRTKTFDKAISDNNRMVIENFMTGINPALG
ncbi:Uncharacterised protein [Klebsiella pneumoniae]|uniref:Uncharacterized protein n=1 Tax=Klebsiella pneumoniae TaxID=573 RepID=A0A377TQB7_KLEPN|nr:Uncharacterised protein [Klebsiella pneumoniae]